MYRDKSIKAIIFFVFMENSKKETRSLISKKRVENKNYS